MYSSIYIVLLACLYGTSLAVPISPDSLIGTAQKLPIVKNPEQGDPAVGGVKRDAARSLVDGLTGSLTEDLSTVGGVDALTDLTHVVGTVPKAAPLAGKRATTGEVVGTIAKLTNDLPVAVKGTDINDITADAPLVGQKRDDAGAVKGLTDNGPISGKKLDPVDIVKSLPLIGDVAGPAADSAIGQQKRDAGGLVGDLPLGHAGDIAKPVTDLIGNLQHLDENITQ